MPQGWIACVWWSVLGDCLFVCAWGSFQRGLQYRGVSTRPASAMSSRQLWDAGPTDSGWLLHSAHKVRAPSRARHWNDNKNNSNLTFFHPQWLWFCGIICCFDLEQSNGTTFIVTWINYTVCHKMFFWASSVLSVPSLFHFLSVPSLFYLLQLFRWINIMTYYDMYCFLKHCYIFLPFTHNIIYKICWVQWQ